MRTHLSHKQNDWLEPFQNWLKDARDLDKIASDDNLFAKKAKAKEIFGSNLLLGEKQVRASAPDLDSFLANSPLDSGRNSGGNHWDALRASRMLASKKPISLLLVNQPVNFWNQLMLELKQLYVIGVEARTPDFATV